MLLLTIGIILLLWTAPGVLLFVCIAREARLLARYVDSRRLARSKVPWQRGRALPVTGPLSGAHGSSERGLMQRLPLTVPVGAAHNSQVEAT
jgi:hypothetical protein